MKKNLLVVGIGLALAGSFLRAGEAPKGPVDDYTKAVVAYVEAANLEMKALHAKADAAVKAASNEEKPRFDDVQRQLDDCDRVLQQLMSANRSNFDRVKSAYEREREDVIKAMDKLKQEPAQ